MIVKKYYKKQPLLKDEKVMVATVNVNLTDGNGDYAEIKKGTKYIVSGDIIKEFFKQVPVKKVVKPVSKEVNHGS